jgi:hypothetical protein
LQTTVRRLFEQVHARPEERVVAREDAATVVVYGGLATALQEDEYVAAVELPGEEIEAALRHRTPDTRAAEALAPIGLSKVRNLSARRDPEVAVHIQLADAVDQPSSWRYELGIRQETRGRRLPLVAYERVWHRGREVLTRPNEKDHSDPQQLTQTYLEQIGANAGFRDVARFLQSVTYLHLVPQLLRHADQIQGRVIEDDPFGQAFLERIAKATDKRRRSRLRLIEEALQIAVPQLQQLRFVRDDHSGRPHLEALYSHWRPKAGWQREDQFSDGTLRLIGLLWSLLEDESLLLLEEPEQSLNAGIVSELAAVIHRVQRRRRRQVLISTHSDDLLRDRGIDGREVLMLTPGGEGTEVRRASDIAEVRALLEAGFSAGEAVLSRSKPGNVDQLSLLDLPS